MIRFLKQVIIALIFFSVLGSIIYFTFFKKTEEPLPTPQVSARSLEVLSSQLLKIKNFDYDFIAEIKNPNLDLGAAGVVYELKLFDKDSLLINVRNGSMSFLPGQIRYEIISPIITEKEISRTEFKIINVYWEKLRDFIPRGLFLIKNQEYLPLSLEQDFSRLRATVFNNSNFDFDRVDVSVILFDENDKAIAVNKTDIRTFIKGTDRFFEVKWPDKFEGKVDRIEVNAYTDIFSNNNFIREYGTQEKFQEFY